MSAASDEQVPLAETETVVDSITGSNINANNDKTSSRRNFLIRSRSTTSLADVASLRQRTSLPVPGHVSVYIRTPKTDSLEPVSSEDPVDVDDEFNPTESL